MRKEIDFWFSAFDAENYTLSLERDGNRLLLASDRETGESYSVTEEVSDDGIKTFVFTYPSVTVVGEDVITGRVKCSHISAVYFTVYPEMPVFTLGEGEKSLRFTINTIVKPAMYACDVVYS